MKDPKKFYTYAYLREDRTPYYIGKGEGRRAYLQLNHKVKIPPKDRILILKDKLLEEESFIHEKYMIAVFGRKDLGTGILHNRTDGGSGGITGLKHTEETKNKMRRPNTKEHNEKVSESIKRKWENGEYDREKYRNMNLGKKQSEETKNKKSKSLKKYYENNKRIMKEESIEKIKFTLREKYRTGELQNKCKGTKWWNNGKETRQCKECPGEGWKLGMLRRSSKGFNWWNNGKINKKSLECPGKEWKPGMLKRVTD
jgi:hypothetical protein